MTIQVEISNDGKHIDIVASLMYKDLCKSIPGSNYSGKTGLWTVPLSWASCLELRTTFGTALQIGPNLKAWAAHEKTFRVDPSMWLREQTQAPEGFGDQDLYTYQRVGVKFLTTAKRALLADEPGLGKSAQSIRALRAARNEGNEIFPALIVCPNTLKLNWEKEFKQWWPEAKVQVIHGTATQRRKQFDKILNPKEGEEVPEVIIINWESLRAHSRLSPYGSVALKRCEACGGKDPKITEARCEVHERELNKIDFKAVVADEIHRAKSPKAAQSRALWAATGDAEYRFALTGTPLSQDVTDIWAIMHWVAPEEWPQKTKWIDRSVDTLLNGFGGIHILGIKAAMKDEFFKILQPRMRRMLKSVCLPFLPPIIHQIRDIEMLPKQRKAYEQMKQNMIAALEDGDFMVATDALTQAKRLQQFALCYAEMEESPPGSGEYKVRLSDPSATLDAVVEDITNGDYGDSQIAVSAVSSQVLELLKARLEKHDISVGMITGDYAVDVRQNAIDAFQRGEIKVMLYTVQAGGVGVTLTNANVLLRIERPFSLIDDKQANDRVHRIGSQKHESILIVDYVVRNSVQSKVHAALERKGEGFEEIVRDRDQIMRLISDDTDDETWEEAA